jgi:molybdopterin-binding protein
MSRWATAGRVRCSSGPDGRRVIDGNDLARFAVAMAKKPDDGQGSTPLRNRIAGIVTKVRASDGIVQVEVQAGSYRLVALITREVAEDLGLEVGVMADAVMRISDVSIDASLTTVSSELTGERRRRSDGPGPPAPDASTSTPG